MSRPILLATALMAAVFQGGLTAQGQVTSSGLLSPNVLRRNGLERVWYTQIEVDRGRGKVVHVLPYVNHSRSITKFEVRFGNRQYLISELDLDPFGKPLEVAGARLRADDRVAELKKLYPDSSEEPGYTTIISPEITLYATTSRGTVHAIDGETGRTRWVTNVGKSSFPTSEPAANDNFVAVVNGSTLFALRSSDGDFQWQRRVIGVPGSGPALSEEFVFVPMVGGEMESYVLDDSKKASEGSSLDSQEERQPRRPPWIYKSLGRAMIQPSTGLGSLAWPTDRGHLYVAATNTRGIRFRLETRESISSAPVFNAPDRLLVTSTDGYLYCLNPFRSNSNIVWQFSTGESISSSAVCFGDACYFVTDNHRMFSISLTTGLPLWESPTTGIKKVLGASKDRLYVVGEVGRLVIMDVATGARMSDIMTIEYDLHVQNPLTDRIYVGTRNGLIQCLRETGQRWPMFHQPIEKSTKPRPKVIQQPAGGDPDGTSEPDDPFGAPGAKPKMPPAGDDPFAAPAGKGAKPADKGKPTDDPFG